MDPITDMLNRIKSGYAVGKTDVFAPLSNIKFEIAKVLEKEGFLGEIKKAAKGKMKILKISLKYSDKIPVMSGFRRVSKQGQRIYSKFDELRKVKGGYGVSVVSTSKGIMSGKSARKAKLGGEVLIEVW